MQQTNCHPFRHGSWLWMHNGLIRDFHRVKRELVLAVDPSCTRRSRARPTRRCSSSSRSRWASRTIRPAAVERAVGLIEHVGRSAGVEHPIQMTVATTDGSSVWAFRYSSEGKSRSLFYSTRVDTLREQHPEVAVLQELSDESRLVVSEPLGDLAGAWNEVPESHYGVVQEGRTSCGRSRRSRRRVDVYPRRRPAGRVFATQARAVYDACDVLRRGRRGLGVVVACPPKARVAALAARGGRRDLVGSATGLVVDRRPLRDRRRPASWSGLCPGSPSSSARPPTRRCSSSARSSSRPRPGCSASRRSTPIACPERGRRPLPHRAFEPRRIDWWSSVVQFVGTLFFNVTTFRALETALDNPAYDRLVWAPDALGSVCFLVSGYLAYIEVCGAWRAGGRSLGGGSRP